MRVSSFEWDEANLPHATRHGVSLEEIEEVLACGVALLRKGRSGAYLAYGQTLDGRPVLVVFEYRGRGAARPISARPMTRKEKSLVRRRS